MRKKFKILLININKCTQIFIIFVIMFSFIFVSFSTAYTSYLSFYEKKGVFWIDSVIASIYDVKVYENFLLYTGLDTGYGFFSPNVKSDIIIVNSLYKAKQVETKLSGDYLQTREGKIRFRGVNDIFMDKLKIEEKKLENRVSTQAQYDEKIDSLKIQFFRVVLKQMNRHYLNDKTNNYDSVNTKVFLYHYPFLKNYPDLQPKLYEIESTTVSK